MASPKVIFPDRVWSKNIARVKSAHMTPNIFNPFTFCRWTKSERLTWGFVQVRLDVEAMSSKSLLCFSSGGRNSYGLLFCNFIFCNFIGRQYRADSHKFRTCTKPCPLAVIPRHTVQNFKGWTNIK